MGVVVSANKLSTPVTDNPERNESFACSPLFCALEMAAREYMVLALDADASADVEGPREIATSRSRATVLLGRLWLD